MELTPQSARSPTLPFRYNCANTSSHNTSNPQTLYEYPLPAQSDSVRYRSTNSFQGLGFYSRPLSGSNGETTSGGSAVTDVQSPIATNRNWPTIADGDTSRTSSHSTPNILSTEYDAWVSFPLPAVSNPFSHDIYGASPAECAILSASSVPLGNTSKRSSFSSTPSDILTQAGSIHSYTPRIKMEDHSDFMPGDQFMMMSSPQSSHNLLVTAASTYSGSLDASFYPDQSSMGWPKMEYSQTTDPPSISIPHYDRRSESRERCASSSKSQTSGSVARVRQPRKHTTKDDANYQCRVKGCEKFFGRSYNFKAHMETHDAGREYPFPCPLKDCNKKFVRKTDLQRHHQSVHMKQKDHKCEYCSRFFARKDTLRRHMEDGCSRRFDIETVDFRPDGYNNDQDFMRPPPRASGSQNRYASYSPSAHDYDSPPPSSSMAPYDGTLMSSSGAFLGRQEYLDGDGAQGTIWSD